MAQGGDITFTVKVDGYWQCCPICMGCGTVPPDFYEQVGFTTTTARTRCRRCNGTGTVEVPIVSQKSAKPSPPPLTPAQHVAARLTPEGFQVLERALREALSAGHNYTGPEHIRAALDRMEAT